MKDAVVLLSGGLDSYTAAAVARDQGFQLYALTVRYGQRHARELDAARAVASALRVARHLEIDVDLAAFGGSSLTSDIPVPKDRMADPVLADGIPDARRGGPTDARRGGLTDARRGGPLGPPGGPPEEDIPSTYVPARNTIFLALALGWAEALGATDIFIGVNALDYSGYPDCRPEYITAFEQLASLATARGVQGEKFRIHAPLQMLTKAEIIVRGVALGLDYGLTHSCYDPSPSGQPCGRCDSCTLRAAGFAQAGIADPAQRR